MKTIALFANLDKPDAIAWTVYSAKKLIKMGAGCISCPEVLDKINDDIKSQIQSFPIKSFDKHADAVLTFGGDGTILSAFRELIKTDLPIMGVNVGKLGFLAEYSIDQIDKSLEELLRGEYRIIPRAAIEATIGDKTFYALNEFVIEKRNSSRMIIVSARANNNLIADYRADGLIVATPTGSTAYSLSCGGPIISPSTEALCITPISPHSLNLRPLVIPDSFEISLEIFSPTGEAYFVADGVIDAVLTNNDKVTIRKSAYSVKLIKKPEGSYFDLLKAKLLWATNSLPSHEGFTAR